MHWSARATSRVGRSRSGVLAAWLIPAIVLVFAVGIVIARMVAPNDAPSQTAANDTPTEVETETETPGETPTEPVVVTPTPFVPLAALPSRKFEAADLSKAVTAKVTGVIDGDTFTIEPEGTGPDLADLTVRMYGIDAPEVFPENRKQRCGPEAKRQLEAILPPGTEVLLLPDERDKDRFDRLLRYVFLPNGDSLDAGMVMLGLANAWTTDGSLRRQLKALEEDASLHNRGCLAQPG